MGYTKIHTLSWGWSIFILITAIYNVNRLIARRNPRVTHKLNTLGDAIGTRACAQATSDLCFLFLYPAILTFT